jgi:ammonium transporter, Amt family
MAMFVLIGAMFIIMLMRVGLPFGAKVEGRPVRQIRLNFRERMLMQRVNVYSIGIVLLLTAVSGMLSPLLEMVVIGSVFALLMLPVKCSITTAGVAVNNVVFRPLAEFAAVEESRRGLRLVAQPGVRNLDLPLLGAHRQEALQVIRLPRATRGAAPRGSRKGR